MKTNYNFKYGSSSVDVALENTDIIGVLEGNPTVAIQDIKTALYKALENPIDSKSLKEAVSGCKKIVIVVSDMTRFWMRQDLVVPFLVDYLTKECSKSYDDLEIVIANGTHIGGDENELRTLVTSRIFDKVKTVNHDCMADDLVYLGTTEFETPVYVNKDAASADLVICLGAATYHVMAGFGGGRKSILPGISGLQTIMHNHAYSLDSEKFITNSAIGNGILKGNPLHEDMCQAASLMPNLFMITLVTDSEFRLTDIYAGHWKTSWEHACNQVRRMYTVPIKEKADVVITSCGGYPKDISLYQGTKTVDNVVSALKDGGTLILFLEGREGGGSPDYFDWIKPLTDGSFEEKLRTQFTVGGYIFFLNCEQAAKFNILMLSKIPKETVAPMGIHAYTNLDELLKDAHLEGKSIYVIPNGSTVLPKLT